jgi:hypothetical protein
MSIPYVISKFGETDYQIKVVRSHREAKSSARYLGWTIEGRLYGDGAVMKAARRLLEVAEDHSRITAE